MKKFRKISSLALVLVLVCLCAASAFAASILDYNEPFNGCNVNAYGRLQRYDIFGRITVEDEGGRNYFQVSMEVWYIGEDANGSPTTYKWPSTVTKGQDTIGSLSAQKTWTSAEIAAYNITCMSYANGVFKADVNNRQTTSRYIGGPWYFSYLML